MTGRPVAAQCIFRDTSATGHLEVWDEGHRRSLWFDDVILQSEIDLADAGRLPNPVNRAMLAPLMLNPAIGSVLLAGCGGGAIARWFHAHEPTITGDAVELSPAVAGVAREFFDFPPQTSNWRLIVDDIQAHLRETTRNYDFILVDLAEQHRTPAWVIAEQFLTGCREHLSKSGVIVLNLIAESTQVAADQLADIRRVFTMGVGLLADPDHDNLLVLAGCQRLPTCPKGETLERLSRRWGIDFHELAARLTRVPAASAGPHEQYRVSRDR